MNENKIRRREEVQLSRGCTFSAEGNKKCAHVLIFDICCKILKRQKIRRRNRVETPAAADQLHLSLSLSELRFYFRFDTFILI